MKENQIFLIAIDGHSSCGKSTLAKDLAKKLDFTYIDSGAMYRSVSLYFLNNNVEIEVDRDYKTLLDQNVNIGFKTIHGKRFTFLNGNNVEEEIRSPKIAAIVSEVAANSSVRSFLVNQQRQVGKVSSLVMDGRDIGSVVFPDAHVKFFVTADINVRTQRRYDELVEKGTVTTIETVKENLTKRDHIDSTRADSPLIKVDDAIEIDTSNHTRESQTLFALEMVMSKMSK